MLRGLFLFQFDHYAVTFDDIVSMARSLDTWKTNQITITVEVEMRLLNDVHKLKFWVIIFSKITIYIAKILLKTEIDLYVL